MSSGEPGIARGLRSLLRTMQSDAARVSWAGRAWRLVAMVPVFGLYLLIAWWRLLRKRPIEVVTTLRCGGVLRCRPPDLVTMYAHVFGVWEPDVSRFIARRLQPGDVFIDIGANVGYDTVLAARIVGRSGAVVAVEASPRIHSMLQANVQRNTRLTNIRTVQAAAGAACGELTVRSGPEHNLGLTTTSARAAARVEATVPAMPLHDLLSEQEINRTRLVKIDIEGGEDHVLAGMKTFIERCSGSTEILVELTPRWWSSGARTPADVLRPFVDAGFNVYEVPNNYWPWRYLWPDDVQRPQRVRSGLDRPTRRIDLVLSREDAEFL